MKQSVLIIEDDKTMRVTLSDALKSKGYTVYAAMDGKEGMTAISEGIFSLIITDVRLPDISGMEILRHVRQEGSSSIVIVMTAYGSIEHAVEAIKNGAYDYITKPFDLDEMLLIVHRALDHQAVAAENVRLKKELSSCYKYPNIIGESECMRNIFSLLDRVSRTDSTVLILGESGTGKELIAAAVHYHSSRKDKPLIKVNCAALPENLIGSELFGYEKGAFTGADARKTGRFEMADGGTIFLDEIGDLPMLTQTKILRVIEEQTFERLGGTKTLQVDVRIIAATNKDLSKEVKRKTFREDLYFRLHVIPVELPPLRKRRNDIPLLVDLFCKRFNDQLGTAARFDPGAVEVLMKYGFPGNVRELRNIIERCIALADNQVIMKKELPPHMLKNQQKQTPLADLAEILAEAEMAHIEKILKITGGNRTRAAELLGISRKTVWEKINLYKIDA